MVSVRKNATMVHLGDNLVFLLDSHADIRAELHHHIVLMPRIGDDMTYETDIKQIDYP